MNTELMFSSDTKNWSTPQDLFNQWDSQYHFTLDAAADTSNYKVKRYFNEKTNGLAQDWSNDVVWINPPYGRGLYEWVRKIKEESGKGATIVALLPARTDTKWFHEYVYHNEDAKITFLKGRVKFSNSKSSAPFPSMIVEFNRAHDDRLSRSQIRPF